MKITMYELLGLVKDDKAPKKIKYKDKIYYYHKGYDFNYIYNSSDTSPADREKSLFTFSSYKLKDGRQYWDDNATIDFLNSEVEILEEEKKIPEKLKDILKIDDLTPPVDENMDKIWTQTIKNQNKINEICDYLKSKGDE